MYDVTNIWQMFPPLVTPYEKKAPKNMDKALKSQNYSSQSLGPLLSGEYSVI